MKQKYTIARMLLAASLVMTAAASIGLCISQSSIEVNAAQSSYNPSTTYTTGDAATYYSGISDVETGTTLLSSLRSLNSNRKKTTVGYSNMNNNASGTVTTAVTGSAFKYTEYDPSSATTDSKGQPYGLTIISFYSGNKITNSTSSTWNREHVWPNSHGGDVVEGDIFMPKPTLVSENSSRSNFFYNEVATPSQSEGWDPASMGDETYRGDSARDIFYCIAANSQLSLVDTSWENTSKDNQSFKMGKLSKLLEWNLKYPVLDRENRRNEGGEYLQGNRNPFVDHPEYACKIWGDTNATTKSVCAAGAQYATLKSISLNQNTIQNLANGSTIQLTATATYSDESTADFTNKVTWASSNESVATVNSTGLVTSHSTSSADYANITATYSDKSATCQFFGSEPVAADLTGVSASAVTVTVGTTQTITPSPLPANAYPVPTYSYVSNNSTIASVTSAGVVTGVAIGSTTITVTATQGSIVKTANIAVTVNETPVTTSATVVYTDFSTYDSSEAEHITADGNIKLNAMNVGTYSANKIQFKKDGGYFYNSESLNLQSITITGSTGTLTVYGSSTANGKTKAITATSGVYDLSGYKYFTIINNTSNAITCTSITLSFAGGGSGSTDSVSLDQSSLSMAVGGSDVTLTATASGAVTWSSNAESVATVSNGVVHAVSAGSAVITATCGSATATCNVTVSAASSGDSVSLNVSSLSLKVGQTNTLVATASGTVTWSSDSANATVSNGIVNAVSVGNATITATCGSASATCNVTISAADVASSNTITFLATGDTSDGSTELNSTTILDNITAGANLIKSYKTLTKLFAGKSGLKLGSKSAAGVLTFTLADTIAAKTVSKITVYGVQYGTDKGTLDLFVNGSKSSSAAPSATGTEATIGSTVSTISVQTSAKRAYLTSIKLDFAGSTEYTADTFAQDFLDNVTCDSTGATAPNLSKTWSELTNLYSSISSETEKAKLINATYTVAGTGASTVVTATGTTTSVVANAMYRYDYIITKYGTTTYTNFITGRTPSALNVSPVSQNIDSSNYIPLIVIISLASVSAIAGYIFSRSRKEK